MVSDHGILTERARSLLRMKWLLASQQFYPEGGGAELATWLHVQELLQRGFEVCVVTGTERSVPVDPKFNSSLSIRRVQLRFREGGRYDNLSSMADLTSP